MRPSSRTRGGVAASALLAALVAACGHADPGGRGVPQGRGQPPPDGPEALAASSLRIVSLSPALSRTLVDFGLGDRIVGRTPYCRSVSPEVRVVGDLLDVDYERLLRLEPTHLLLQPPRSTGPDARLLELAAAQGWTVAQWTIDTIPDIERTVREIPAALYPIDGESRRAAARRAEELLAEIAAALAPTDGEAIFRGPTLLADGTNGVLVHGRRTYLDDVLASLGGTNAVSAAGWIELSIEDVLRLDPAAVIVVRDRPPLELPGAAGVLARLDLAAARAGRVAVLHHPDANLPSTGVVGVARELRRVLTGLAAAEPP